jgi:hypothetical protein
MNKQRNNQFYRRGFYIMAALLALAVPLGSGIASAAMAKLTDGVNTSFHDSILAAYDTISSGSAPVISAQAGTFREDMDFNRSWTIKLKGGYDANYQSIVGSTSIAGDLTISSGTVEVDTIALTSPPAGPVRIIYLHHSTGGVVWNGGVPGFFESYNSSHDTDYQISERAYPDGVNYPWANYPYDYWKLWVDTTGPVGYEGQDTLDTLASDYDVIVFKHCFPVSNIEADSGSADITSETKSLQNYKLQYNALKARMRQFPTKKFIVWTGAALIQGETTPENADRARQFFNWVRTVWDEKGDNIFVWDFWTLETEGGLYLKPVYSAGDSHPNALFSSMVAPLIAQRIVDVIEGAGDSGSITGE